MTLTDRPTALLALTAFPRNDGQVVLELIPEVQYGEQRSSFVTNALGVRQEMRREARSWKSLKIRAPLAIGNILMISATSPPQIARRIIFRDGNRPAYRGASGVADSADGFAIGRSVQ